MSKHKQRFISAFEKDIQLQRENIDPLTHALPHTKYTLRHQVIGMLSKIRDQTSMITVLGFSSEFFSFMRKTLLLECQDLQQSQAGHGGVVNQLYLSSKIEIVPMQPVEWLYGQVRLKKEDFDGSLSPIRRSQGDFIDSEVGVCLKAAIMGSSAIIIDARDSQVLEQQMKVLKEVREKLLQLPSFFPKIYAVYNSKTQNESEINIKMSALIKRDISVELIASNVKEEWEEQYRMISIGKQIISKLSQKVIEKVALTSRLMSILWSSLALADESVPLSVLWQKSQASLMEEHSEQAMQQYLSRIEDVTEGQPMVSSTFLKEAQAKVRLDVMKIVSQKVGSTPNIQSIMKTERRLLDLKEEMETKNFKAVQEWGKDFLKEAWSIIEQKTNKQIKNVFGLRQQTQIFFEFFKKKSEQFISTDLLLLFIDFLIPKVFDGIQSIVAAMITPLQEEQMTMQTQLMNLAVQNKDLRRRGSKEDSELYHRIQELQEKVFQLQSNNTVADRCLSMTKNELSEQYQHYQSAISEMEAERQLLLKGKDNKLEELTEMLDTERKKGSILESELTKEKLLHEQTRHFYQETVDMVKRREEIARNQLEQANLSASREIINLRQSSTKELGSHQMNNAELFDKLAEKEEIIDQKERLIEKLSIQVSLLKEAQGQSQILRQNIEQLEMQNRILQDIELQNSMLLVKSQKIEEQNKRMLRQRETQSIAYQEIMTKNMIGEEMAKSLKEEMESYRADMRELKVEKETFIVEREDFQVRLKVYEDQWRLVDQRQQNCHEMERRYEQKIAQYQESVKDRREVVSIGFQVDNHALRQKLKMALETIKLLEDDYQSVRMKYQWKM